MQVNILEAKKHLSNLVRLIEKGKELGAEKIYLESSVMGVPLYSSMGFEDMHGYMKLA